MADTTYTNTVGFAPEVAPLANDVIARSRALIDAPYEAYDQDRIAQFTPLQQQAFESAGYLGPTSQSLNAAYGLQGLAQRAGQLNYAGSNYGNQFRTPGNLDYAAAQSQAARLGNAPTAQAARLGNAPTMQAASFNAPGQVGYQNVNVGDINAAQTDYAPRLRNYQMDSVDDVNTSRFGQADLDRYMNPYMQDVVDVQKREAQRASDIQSQQDQARAAQSGAFGGSRDALIRAERERNMGTQLNDIQSQGSNMAFQQAQQQFNADQARRLAAQQGNQQAGLTVGQQNLAARLGVQQLGTQTGAQMALANLSNRQQAAVQNEANRLQASGMNQQAAMQAALANQQMGYNTNLQNAQMRQQAAANNQALQGQYGLQQGQFTQGANLANQALQGQYGLQQGQFTQASNLANQAALNQQRQFGAGQNLTAAQSAAQYGQAANQLNEQSRQYGAGLGLQGIQAGLAGYGQLADAGQNIYNQQANAVGIQNAFGTQQQQGVQNMLTQQYQDFLDQKNYPYKQLQWGMEMARGAPTSNLGQSMYTSGPSTLNTVAGLGTTAAGLWNQYNRSTGNAKGGQIKAKKQGGLPAILVNSMA
jgi:hypothetical protein